MQARAGQDFERGGFSVGAALQANRFAFRQGDEVTLFIRPDFGVGITKDDARDIERPAAVTVGMLAPGAVAVGVQGVELEYGAQGRFDQAQAGAGIFCWRRQFGCQFGQRFSDQRGFLG